MPIGFNTVGNSSLSANTAKASGEFEGLMSGNLDSTNPTDMMKIMQASNKWSVAMNLESSLVKLIADTIKGVIQKIG
jgi:type III secretion apparatus needle protein